MEPAPRAAPLTLVLGGARSGKSRFAEDLAVATGLARIYVATAEAYEDEMRERIAVHRARRDDDWTTVDAPLDLPAALDSAAGADRVVLVDCLTLWLSNVMLAAHDVDAALDGLLAALARLSGPAILVSNEVGSGIVPDTRLGRDFRDHQGRLNQRVAAVADRVTLVVAGLPLDLKLPKEPA